MLPNANPPERIVATLTGRRVRGKREALRDVSALREVEDIQKLKRLILTQLTGFQSADLSSSKVNSLVRAEQNYRSDVRSWLISALGIIARCGKHDDARDAVKHHLDTQNEDNEWVRAWAAVAIISAEHEENESLIRYVSANDPSLLLQGLATLYLASIGDVGAARSISESLAPGAERTKKWAILRAVRWLPSSRAEIVANICAVVEIAAFDDITYDAICALDAIGHGIPDSELIAQTLRDYVARYRWPMYDTFRIPAICALRHFRSEQSATLLVDDLLNENPGICRAASQTLEMLVGTERAVGMLLDHAQSLDSQPSSLARECANSFRSMNRNGVISALDMRTHSASPTERTLARAALEELGGADVARKLYLRQEVEDSFAKLRAETEEQVRLNFDKTISRIENRTGMLVNMNLIVFALGIVIAVCSAGLALRAGEASIPLLLSGGMGLVTTFFGMFITNSQDRITDVVRSVTRSRVAFLTFFHQLNQINLVHAKQLVRSPQVSLEDAERVLAMMQNAATEALKHLEGQGPLRPNDTTLASHSSFTDHK